MAISGRLRIAFLAAECEPWAKTGGLADVVDALARALGQVGAGRLELPVDVFLPRYRSVQVPDRATSRVVRVPDPLAPDGLTDVRVLDVAADGYRLRLVDHPPAFDRSSYYGPDGSDYPDNAWRFGLFCAAALETLRSEGRVPDVLHLHDWHTGPALLLRDGWARAGGEGSAPFSATAALLTVHNLAYHGWTPRDHLDQLGLRPGDGVVATDADGIDLLLAGIERADLVNTVSPGFAAEALGRRFGMGLDADLRAKGDRFFGILNGLDTDLWDPATDPVTAAPYSASDRSGKATCRADLLERVGMDPQDRGAVLGMIGRLDPQKGFDLLAAAAASLVRWGVRLVVQGSGPSDLVASLRELAAERPDRVALIERFDREMARRIYAGVDGFLMPSRFEPCGTGQMIALRYGTPPIVHATGGLKDTVVDEHERPGEGTGFVFGQDDREGLLWACDRFLARFEERGPAWERLVDRGMAVDFDWRTQSAPAYVAAYERAVAIRRGLR